MEPKQLRSLVSVMKNKSVCLYAEVFHFYACQYAVFIKGGF